MESLELVFSPASVVKALAALVMTWEARAFRIVRVEESRSQSTWTKQTGRGA
jgi:hypothetical protein